ncbi:DMSO reductase subunit B [Mizugakiibacter sediminis]|uniref:DMSO reductase subunit B n=1 Tax=Mizugakiibacter sediminis TaxID=1475481 RepID=A0A0K8QLD7_9GAMM|nr:4Fe-4S dicluster domain-containing protein [Mizugakiibacter sediminis]GAP65536.1 DMSO reductase subunit B [Mizugakiibacter sediminis]
MTALPPPPPKKLGLVIDLDTCVGCHACAVACKSWNDGGAFGPLPDADPLGAAPDGVWFNRVHTYEVTGLGTAGAASEQRKADDGGRPEIPTAATAHSRVPPALTIHFPRSCLHCETPACVPVCPTGASYKRAEDGIVLVDADKCIGCQLCAWACPYGAREFSAARGVMQKCTLCVDRIYDDSLAPQDRQPACVAACPTRARHFGDLGDPHSEVSKLVAERGGFAPLQELGYAPVNRYLPPRPHRDDGAHAAAETAEAPLDGEALPPLLRWLDRLLSR